LHRLEEQKLQALFTSSQKRGSIQKLLQAVTSRLQRDKPKADMLMIMAVGD
jgi:ubiquinone biosynthesis protein COQ9